MRECKLPLRTVLQNFINNVESLEAKRENKEEVYDQEFQELKKLTESLKTHPEYACTEGEKEFNKRKNRYKDILPYDRTRVVLQAFPGIPGSDYINANYIRGASGSRAYIASQGPLANTVPDFWRMVVECDVQVIIMASNETEGGKHKCQCYWVENKGEEKQFGNVLVSFIKSRQVSPHFLVRTLKITFTTENDKTEERTICQFHYMLWPDHGVPDTVRPLLHMVRLVRDCQASETLPVLVHCSAGCGRTGTICAIDYVWGLLRTGKLYENLHLLGLVREMRVQRVAMVQTKEQYTLLHQAVKELFRDRLNLIDSHPYENISTDGNPLMLQLCENKESDYEDFLLSQEKEDGTSSPGNPSGSLTRKTSRPLKPRLPKPKDPLRRSASTSSLDIHKTFPPLASESALLLPLTSTSLDASPYPQKEFSACIDFDSEPNLHRRPQAVPLSAETKSPAKRPPRLYSKVEKEAENLAQKMETKQRQKLNCLNPGSSSHTDPLNSRPNFSLTVPGTLSPPPVPPPRSRTPSPIISVRNTHFDSEHRMKGPVPRVTKEMPTEKRKSLELVRRPSIPKLRELFEKSPSTNVITCPNGAHLCRSASSVTPRSSLFSLHSDSLVPPSLLKVKRNASFRSEESLAQSSKMSSPAKDSDHFKFQICPPPPPSPPQYHMCVEDSDSSLFAPLSGKPPSSPRLGTVRDVKRKVPQMSSCNFREDRATRLTHLDERPVLPIKKSKSFRLARPQPTTSPPSLIRGAEFPKKKPDLTTYFSLDRGKENSPSRTSKGENSIKKIANDFFPLHQEGLKLSVYESSLHSRPSSTSTSLFSEDSPASGKENESDRPLIPPKKTSHTEGRDKSSKMCKLLQMSLSRSDEQIHQSSLAVTSMPSISKNVQVPLFMAFKDTPALENDHNTEMTENLYDELPCHPFPLPKTEVTLPSTQSEALGQGSGLQESKDYVNARVLTSYLGKSDSQSLSYAPLPSKRESKEKAGHDYANCCVFAISDSKIDTGKTSAQNVALFSNQQDNLVSCKSKPTADNEGQDSGQLSTHSSADYEPVDFGETLTSVDEVFETVNYELVEGKSKGKKNQDEMQSLQLDYYLNKDLDSLAIQVYKDCQAYLLNGNSQAPVPSLMPNCKLPNLPNSNLDKIYGVPDLEEVRNKVSVPPQGLRNRERRNSYRQAVSMASPPHNRIEKIDKASPFKKIHKYEKIWFETMNEQRSEEGHDDLQNKPEEMTAKSSAHDFSSNLNHPMNINGKEVLFKDKLEELHRLVSNAEQKNLTDLSEEELSSRDSGSSSSLFSRSAQSCLSEKGDPIYANVPFALGSFLPAFTEVSGKPTHTSSFQGSSSPYATLATTTTHPYKPRMAPPQHKISPSWVTGPFKNSLGAATLPAKSTASPPPHFPLAQNVPPPMGFGNPVFQNRTPFPVDTAHVRAEHPSGRKSLFSPVFRSHSIKGVVSSEKNLPLEPEPDPESAKQRRHHPKTQVTKRTSPLHKGKELRQDDYSRGTDRSMESSSMPGYENESYVAEGQDTESELSLNPPPLSDSASDPPNPSLNPSVYYHPPMVSKSASQWGPNSLMTDDTQAPFPPEMSSTDTDDEPLSQKASTSNLLRKLTGTNSKASAKGTATLGKNDDVGSSFFREDKGAKRPCSPPGSPRPFTKAFGKLKSGSKFVATNLKSYLSSRGNLDSYGAPLRHYPLQKSISLGPSVNVLAQVVDDCTPPSHLPKKPNRELLPHTVHSHHQYHPSKAEPKASRARQQYL